MSIRPALVLGLVATLAVAASPAAGQSPRRRAAPPGAPSAEPAQVASTPATAAPGVIAVPSPEAAIALALERSQTLRAAQEAVRASRGDLLQAGLRPNPELQIDNQNASGSGPYRGGRPLETNARLSQRLEVGGQRAARAGVAARDVALTGHDLAAARLDLIRDVRAAFAQAVAARRAVAIEQDRRRIAEEFLRATRERVRAGREAPAQELRAETALSAASIAQDRALQEAAVARRALAVLLAAEEVEIAGRAADAWFADIGPAPAAAAGRRLEANPDFARLGDAVERARAALELERRRAVPDVTVSGAIGRYREASQTAMDTTFILGVSVPLQVFDRNQGNIARAGADLARTEFVEPAGAPGARGLARGGRPAPRRRLARGRRPAPHRAAGRRAGVRLRPRGLPGRQVLLPGGAGRAARAVRGARPAQRRAARGAHAAGGRRPARRRTRRRRRPETRVERRPPMSDGAASKALLCAVAAAAALLGAVVAIAVPPVGAGLRAALGTVAPSLAGATGDEPPRAAPPRTGAQRDGHAHAPGAGGHGEEAPEGSVRMTEEQIAAARIEVAEAGSGTVARRVSLPGTVAANADRLAHVPARVAGIVTALNRRLGDQVAAGEVLAVVESAEIADREGRLPRRAAHHRARPRHLRARAAPVAAQDLRRAGLPQGADRLAGGADPPRPRPPEAGRHRPRRGGDRGAAAPADRGAAAPGGAGADRRPRHRPSQDARRRGVVRGGGLHAGRPVHRLGGDGGASRRPRLRARRAWRCRVRGEGEARGEGRVVFLSPVLDPETRSARAVVELPNPDGAFRPGGFATAEVATEEQARGRPGASRGGAGDRRARASSSSARRRASRSARWCSGAATRTGVEVVFGLDPGERYAAANTFVLKAELGKSEAEHSH